MKSLASLLLALLLAFPGTSSAGWSLDQLMSLLAANPGGTVRFVERKFLAILDRPIESSGEMTFYPPDRLERQTFKPRAESMVLSGDTLSLARDGRSITLRLREHPEAAVFIDSIRSTLAGNRAALERNFLLSLAGTPAAWSLDLLPSDARLAELVLRIHIEGRAGQIHSIAIQQGDGDRSVLELEQLPARRPAATGS